MNVQPGRCSLARQESAMNACRALGVLAAVAAFGATGVVPASAADDPPDTELTAHGRAVPNKAGTKRRPRGVTIIGRARLDVEPGADPPIVTGMDILVGRGLVWNADDYVRCTKRALDRNGVKGCPRRSVMGSAKATGYADTVPAHADVVFVNGGWKRTFAYTTLYNPALVQETIVVRRTKEKGRWAHRESFRVPKTLQVVAGVPIRLSRVRLRFGGRPYAREYITSTSCPKGGWRYRVIARYLFDRTGQRTRDAVNGRIRCRR